jgi:aspartate aminotransferase
MISSRVKEITPSATLKITSEIKRLKKEGKKVINFAGGEPDFDTPHKIKEAAKKAIDSGFTKYTPVAGIPELRQKICQRLKQWFDLNYQPEEIVISNGAKHAIFNALYVILEPGDEVLIFSPYWVSYPEMVKLCSGKPVIIDFKEQDGFHPDFNAIKSKITPKTKCIILNSPCNPTGVVWKKEELFKLTELAIENNLFIISDEIYSHLIYEYKHFSIAGFNEEIWKRTITINGVSKTYSMTGWRIGWSCSPKEIATQITKIQGQMTSNACSISQMAALAALDLEKEEIEKMREIFKQRRDILTSELKKLGLSFIYPEGAFYLFLKVSNLGYNSFEFAEKLLKQKMVGVIPGRPFGNDEYVRISYATSEQEIQEGLRRLGEFISG